MRLKICEVVNIFYVAIFFVDNKYFCELANISCEVDIFARNLK